MRKVESLSIKYLGYSDPKTEDEVILEQLGLETLIAYAKQRIAVLQQSMKISKLMNESIVEETTNEKTVNEADKKTK